MSPFDFQNFPVSDLLAPAPPLSQEPAVVRLREAIARSDPESFEQAALACAFSRASRAPGGILYEPLPALGSNLITRVLCVRSDGLTLSFKAYGGSSYPPPNDRPPRCEEPSFQFGFKSALRAQEEGEEEHICLGNLFPLICASAPPDLAMQRLGETYARSFFAKKPFASQGALLAWERSAEPETLELARALEGASGAQIHQALVELARGHASNCASGVSLRRRISSDDHDVWYDYAIGCQGLLLRDSNYGPAKVFRSGEDFGYPSMLVDFALGYGPQEEFIEALQSSTQPFFELCRISRERMALLEIPATPIQAQPPKRPGL